MYLSSLSKTRRITFLCKRRRRKRKREKREKEEKLRPSKPTTRNVEGESSWGCIVLAELGLNMTTGQHCYT